MEAEFFSNSKEIANKFIRNILFIDDEINNGESGNYSLDSNKLLQVFAQSKKLCSLNCPKKESDLINLTEIALLADITILDWRMNLTDDKAHSADEGEEKNDEEEIIEESDSRGRHTIQLIENIYNQSENQFKLILIYTGETNLRDIVDKLYDKFHTFGFKKLDSENGNQVGNSNFRIIVTGKESLKGKFKHNPELNKWILEYEKIPDFILTEFAKMTSGILSNFILQSLSLIRQNTFKLISIYNKDLDQPYLFHKLLLPNPQDAEEQLIEIITHSIQSILNYQNDNIKIVNDAIIHQWVKEQKFSFTHKFCKKDISIDSEFIIDWLKLGYSTKFINYWKENNFTTDLDKLDSSLNELAQKGSGVLNNTEGRIKDAEFSILTHHKSNVKLPSQKPRLTLGTVIYKFNDDKKEYYLCIQARCDSVRVKNGQRFIFLQLDTVEDGKKFNILAKNETEICKFKYGKNSYDLKTFKFNPSSSKGTVIAIKYGDKYYFESIWNEKLYWVCDLKDLHSQRISNIFASQLSRVGLEESEWLRRWGNNS